MYLDFEKWQGCANDFVVLWISDRDGDVVLGSLKRQAKDICDRHLGVGADGLLVLQTKVPEDLMPYKMTIINSDGSVAQNCGNGLRCASLSIRRRHDEVTNDLPEAIEIEVEGLKGIIGIKWQPVKQGSMPYSFSAARMSDQGNVVHVNFSIEKMFRLIITVAPYLKMFQ